MAEKTHEEKLIELLFSIPVFMWSKEEDDPYFKAEHNGKHVFLYPSPKDSHFTIGRFAITPDQNKMNAYIHEINDYFVSKKKQAHQQKCADLYNLLTEKKQ